MNAHVGSNSSFVWRSLAWSRPLLHCGLRWKVGDGRTIRVFRDAWILEVSSGLLPLTPGVGEDFRVADFKTVDNNWDKELIACICDPVEVELICKQTVGSPDRNDVRYWKYDDSGTYSVKTGYLVETNFYNPPINSTGSSGLRWTNLAWKLNVPPKVKVFAWKMFREFIPVEVNLHNHHVPCHGVCGMCGIHWGTTAHSLIFCKKTKPIWKVSRYWFRLRRCKHLNICEIGIIILDKFSQQDFNLWVILLWSIWKWVCDAKHGKEVEGVLVDEERCSFFLQSFQKASSALAVTPFLGVQPGSRAWFFPDAGTYRVDVDAMFNEARQEFGIGVVIRDCQGSLVVAMSKPVSNTGSVLQAESLAILEGIVVSIEQKLAPIVIYSDSLLAVRAIAKMDEEQEDIREDLQVINDMLEQGSLLGVHHMYRTANRAAHAVAQFAAQIDKKVVWKSFFPAWLKDVNFVDILQS